MEWGQDLVPPFVQVEITGHVFESGLPKTRITAERDPELRQRLDLPQINVGGKRKGPDPPRPDGVLSARVLLCNAVKYAVPTSCAACPPHSCTSDMGVLGAVYHCSTPRHVIWAWASFMSGLSPHRTQLWTAGKASPAVEGHGSSRSRERATSNLPEDLNPLVAWVLYEHAHHLQLESMDEEELEPCQSIARHIGDRCPRMLANTNGVPAQPVFQLTSGAPVLTDMHTSHSDLIKAFVRSCDFP